jgi:carboxylesterase type B
MLPSFTLVLGILLICGSRVECQPLVSIPLGQIQGSFMSSASGRQFMAFRGIPYAKPPVGELRFKVSLHTSGHIRLKCYSWLCNLLLALFGFRKIPHRRKHKLQKMIAYIINATVSTNCVPSQEPIAAEPFDGILDARREGPMCIQFDSMIRTLRGTEDCLVVNVYTHSVRQLVQIILIEMIRIFLQQTPKNGPLPVMVWIHGGAFYLGSGNGQTDIYGPGYLMDRDIILVTLNYRLGPLGRYLFLM